MPYETSGIAHVCLWVCVCGHAVGQLNFEVQPQYEFICHRMCTCVHIYIAPQAFTCSHASACVFVCEGWLFASVWKYACIYDCIVMVVITAVDTNVCVCVWLSHAPTHRPLYLYVCCKQNLIACECNIIMGAQIDVSQRCVKFMARKQQIRIMHKWRWYIELVAAGRTI